LKKSEILKNLLGVQGAVRAPGECRAKPWWGARGAKPPEAPERKQLIYLWEAIYEVHWSCINPLPLSVSANNRRCTHSTNGENR